MRLILILLSVAVLISLFISGWGLYERTSMKYEIENLQSDIYKLREYPQKAQQPVIEKKVSIDDDPIKGDPKAPVTIIEFSDYECPFRKRFNDSVLGKINEEYISTGKVKYVFRDYPLPFHKKAVAVAVAANCGGEQGKYWEFHDFLFESKENLDMPNIMAYAEELELDKTKFEACVNDKSKESEISEDMEAGRKYGVRGTPSFFIGKTEDGKEFTGTFVRGAQPYSVFKVHIEEQLQEVN